MATFRPWAKKSHWLAFTVSLSVWTSGLFKGHRSTRADIKKPKPPKQQKTSTYENQAKIQTKYLFLKAHFTHWCDVSHWIDFLVGLLLSPTVFILYWWHNTLLDGEFSFFLSLSPCFTEIKFPEIRSLKPSVKVVWSPIHFPDKTLTWNHFICLVFLPFTFSE